ncbi:hypothetical protein GWC77_27495 [Paraburkholderia sp. NMBU_R16]|nr:hypothetical protein [Paraburkholderia sp. NMBU_R16]
MEAGHEPIRYPLRGSIRSTIRVNLTPALNTEILTLPFGVVVFCRFWPVVNSCRPSRSCTSIPIRRRSTEHPALIERHLRTMCDADRVLNTIPRGSRDGIFDYIEEDSPRAAVVVDDRIRTQVPDALAEAFVGKPDGVADEELFTTSARWRLNAEALEVT